MNNWAYQINPNTLTTMDKIRELLSKPSRIVLVQVHELERAKTSRRKDRYEVYVDNLYKHYVINKLGKTYNNK